LPRCENHFEVHFSRWTFGIQHHLLRLCRKSHELRANDVSSPRQADKDKTSAGNCCRGEFLSCQSIRRGQSNARQRCLPAVNAPGDFVSRRLRRGRTLLRAQRWNYDGRQTQENESPNKRSQCGGSGGFCCGLLSFGGFAGGPPAIPISWIRFHCSGPMTITVFGSNALSFMAPRTNT